MTSFKEKPTRYATNPTGAKSDLLTSTLDTQHKNKLHDINAKAATTDKSRRKLARAEQELRQLENADTPDAMRRKAHLKSTIDELRRDIARLDSHMDIMDYFDNTLDILVDYYTCEKATQPRETERAVTLDELFKRPAQDKKNVRYKLYEKYMHIVHNQGSKRTTQQLTICNECGHEKILNAQDGILVCTQCGETEPVLVDCDKGSYKDHTLDSKASAYKRINHLSELLNQFQAKESTDIPDAIFQQIQDELRKQRITDTKTLTYKKMRAILKKLQLNRYYEHVHHIMNRLNGCPPPTMTRETEERLKQMFKHIQKPFLMFRPKKRSNFLSYNYVIHKLCQLLELDEFLPYFPLLKCVAPETMLLTRHGHLPIASLRDQDVQVWNGEQFSTVTVRRTGTAQRLLTVSLSNGHALECTPYHRFFVQGHDHLVEAQDLLPGTPLSPFRLSPDAPLVRTNVVSVVDHGRTDDTYCFHEPLRNAGVFNGILTSQSREKLEEQDAVWEKICRYMNYQFIPSV